MPAYPGPQPACRVPAFCSSSSAGRREADRVVKQDGILNGESESSKEI